MQPANRVQYDSNSKSVKITTHHEQKENFSIKTTKNYPLTKRDLDLNGAVLFNDMNSRISCATISKFVGFLRRKHIEEKNFIEKKKKFIGEIDNTIGREDLIKNNIGNINHNIISDDFNYNTNWIISQDKFRYFLKSKFNEFIDEMKKNGNKRVDDTFAICSLNHTMVGSISGKIKDGEYKLSFLFYDPNETTKTKKIILTIDEKKYLEDKKKYFEDCFEDKIFSLEEIIGKEKHKKYFGNDKTCCQISILEMPDIQENPKAKRNFNIEFLSEENKNDPSFINLALRIGALSDNKIAVEIRNRINDKINDNDFIDFIKNDIKNISIGRGIDIALEKEHIETVKVYLDIMIDLYSKGIIKKEDFIDIVYNGNKIEINCFELSIKNNNPEITKLYIKSIIKARELGLIDYNDLSYIIKNKREYGSILQIFKYNLYDESINALMESIMQATKNGIITYEQLLDLTEFDEFFENEYYQIMTNDKYYLLTEIIINFIIYKYKKNETNKDYLNKILSFISRDDVSLVYQTMKNNQKLSTKNNVIILLLLTMTKCITPEKFISIVKCKDKNGLWAFNVSNNRETMSNYVAALKGGYKSKILKIDHILELIDSESYNDTGLYDLLADDHYTQITSEIIDILIDAHKNKKIGCDDVARLLNSKILDDDGVNAITALQKAMNNNQKKAVESYCNNVLKAFENGALNYTQMVNCLQGSDAGMRSPLMALLEKSDTEVLDHYVNILIKARKEERISNNEIIEITDSKNSLGENLLTQIIKKNDTESIKNYFKIIKEYYQNNCLDPDEAIRLIETKTPIEDMTREMDEKEIKQAFRITEQEMLEYSREYINEYIHEEIKDLYLPNLQDFLETQFSADLISLYFRRYRKYFLG